ncbi:PH domain-containing protein [Bizionia gelidisalsuginis]|uniref:PH domain-containing protein n=2 Tax=Bizionia TaxID=283785 RepID=A0A8H2QJG9_9FLAO|nr:MULTISPECIES: PH domain-containing protein [Bizionia]TYB74477.1 PH domain-containing protein [Bizionia saleffrena]TYC16272.1 PH domain-containing protein [Bizionia gelidisalsuginis]
MEEKEIWKGSPSQWTNFGTYVICLLFSWLIIPIFIAIWRFLVVKTWEIEITEQRLIVEKGVLSKSTEELELYRVKDIRLDQPFFLRLVGLSNITLVTSDRSHSVVRIPAISEGKNLREKLRIAVEERRDKKRVRETDFE